MYAGHAAIALALQVRAPRVPMLAIAVASYGPDIVEMSLMIPTPRGGMSVYAHSVVAVVIGASVAALLYRILVGVEGWKLIWSAWVLHLPPDLLTGRKPLFSASGLVGLDLYHLQWADAMLECVVVVWACRVYANRFATTNRQQRTVVALCMALIILQVLADLALADLDPLPWSPSLALGT